MHPFNYKHFPGFAILRWIPLLILMVSFSPLHAQLCNGSLGDPVVNITFDAGGNATVFSPPHGYIYTGSSCPDDGFYTITRRTSGCFGDAWHTVNSDHTGGGSFMLVNASFDPGDFFLTTVKDLCPNTNYEFAAWLMNVLNRQGIKPNVTFTIETPDGTILQKFSTGDIVETSQPQWKQYGFYFTTPVNNPLIVLRMTNNAPGGNGNDIALDDITFRPCGPKVNSAIKDQIDTLDLCDGNTETFSFYGNASSDYQSPVYQWQLSEDTGKTWKDIPGADKLEFTRRPTGAGYYAYRLSVTEKTSAGIPSCRIASTNLVINVHRSPEVRAGANRIAFLGDTIQLAGSVAGEDPVYSWTPATELDDPGLLDAISKPTSTRTYILYAQSVYGCKSDAEMTIRVVTGIYVPNAFTPNGDGKNDRWHIPYLDPALGAGVRLFNRYGQEVYHVEGSSVDWDGTWNAIPQPSGTYAYLIHFKKQHPDMKGTIQLIR